MDTDAKDAEERLNEPRDSCVARIVESSHHTTTTHVSPAMPAFTHLELAVCLPSIVAEDHRLLAISELVDEESLQDAARTTLAIRYEECKYDEPSEQQSELIITMPPDATEVRHDFVAPLDKNCTECRGSSHDLESCPVMKRIVHLMRVAKSEVCRTDSTQ